MLMELVQSYRILYPYPCFGICIWPMFFWLKMYQLWVEICRLIIVSNIYKIWKEYKSGYVHVHYNCVNTFFFKEVHILSGYIFYYQSNMIITYWWDNVIISLINLVWNITILHQKNYLFKMKGVFEGICENNNCFIEHLRFDFIAFMKRNNHRYWFKKKPWITTIETE